MEDLAKAKKSTQRHSEAVAMAGQELVRNNIGILECNSGKME